MVFFPGPTGAGVVRLCHQNPRVPLDTAVPVTWYNLPPMGTSIPHF